MREALEEGGAALQDILAKCSSLQQVSLGEPVSLHPGYTDKQYQSHVVIHLTAELLQAIKESLEGAFGGIEAEGEKTKPVILSFIDAWNTMLERGENTYGPVMVARFAKDYPDRIDQMPKTRLTSLAA